MPEQHTPAPRPEQPFTPDDGWQDQVIEGHRYDGIKEYDNPMPGWWVWLFWATIAFAPVYVLGIHVFDWIDTYEEDLAEGQAELQEIRAAYAEANPSAAVSEETLARFVGDPSMVEAGAATYEAHCAVCHGQEGGGLIGPNLADAYWIHGGSNMEIYEVLVEGVLDKGMPGWENILSAEQMAELVAFVQSLKGTDPEGAKAPEGELIEEIAAAASE